MRGKEIDGVHPFLKQRPVPSVDLGDDEPLYHLSLKRRPDRRRLSLRWLGGSVVTAIFSVILVGGALQAAIGLKPEGIIRPALAAIDPGRLIGGTVGRKSDRIRVEPDGEELKRVIQVSTVTRVDDREHIKVRPFVHVRRALAAPVPEDIVARVPKFNALALFAEGNSPEPSETAAAETIYGAEVDGEVTISSAPFPVNARLYDETAALKTAEVERIIRENAPFLAEGAVDVASLPYVDPGRFEVSSADPLSLNNLAVAIVPENVSLIEKNDEAPVDAAIEEKIVQVATGDALTKLLEAEGATEVEAAEIQSTMIANFAFDFRAGQKLRLGLAEDEAGRVRPVRVSLYSNGQHLATVALSDGGAYVAAAEPNFSDGDFEMANVADTRSRSSLPSIYSALWRSALSLDMEPELAEKLVRIFSFDTDLQSRTSRRDEFEAVYTGDPDAEELIYASLTVNGAKHRFYRYRDEEDGSIGYYDPDGKSANKFLLRKPVPNAVFRSAFGMRKHPILGRYKLHSGVDWAAPRGSPIIAAGDGIIERASWFSTYGRRVEIKHANGYVSTYNHMSAIAKGIKVGMRVHQGQIIGYIGSTGLSTGPHLHFEVLVNGHFVDPMKIRVPRGHTLTGAELARFNKERQRIDALIARDNSSRVATLTD
ncbi:murein DD-endopeptidase MepM/ murein hydrolase activator NlpD [Rhodopseudomonas julia]|uniref:Murein DD-endopeptidase MepM/ murein hydrolase activator NlpD n=1 Tax=Rhodopseudomonas julia TaxID=200617 RepID=A0ABU0C601_9BRAD|nr:M23 family metallopeptidase [Rhodopseudomonas julia]MDQ0325950.1 murein DD-endopeptidase MepM/ murein hydrolase activator NlpD [Rhodopseudomonas julia]